MDLPPCLRAFARRHDGLITAAAWADSLGGRRSFDRAVAAGWLVRVAPGVAALAGTEISARQRIHGAVLANPHDAVASHRSAAFLWGAPVDGDHPVELITRAGWNASRRSGLVLHRPRDAASVRAVRRGAVPVTTPLRTLLDLGAVAPSAVVPAVEHFLVAGHATVGSMTAALAGHRRRGRPGTAHLAAALDAIDVRVPDSVLEVRMAAVFRRRSLQGWEFHRRVAGFEVDFAFPAERVIVEVDGFAHHADRGAFERDRQRDARLAALGWVVLRFTWRQVMRAPEVVARTVESTLAARTAVRVGAPRS